MEALDRPSDRLLCAESFDLGRDLAGVDELARDRREYRGRVAVAVAIPIPIPVQGREVEGDRSAGHQIAHSPSPRSTLYGSDLLQSMNSFMVSRLNSAGRVSSFTSASKRGTPTRSTKALNCSSPERSAS